MEREWSKNMNTHISWLLAIAVAATCLTAGCSKPNPTAETTEAAGTIVAAKRALNDGPATSTSSAETASATITIDLAAAEEAAKQTRAKSATAAKDAANASAGGPKNGDREMDHNKW